MNSKDGKQSANVSAKLDSLKKQQDEWIEQRSLALSQEKKKKNTQTLPNKQAASKTQPQKSVDKKADTLLWASRCSNDEYSGFVVRKGLCTPDGKSNRRSRPLSATSNKTTSLTGINKSKNQIVSVTKHKTASPSKNESWKDPIIDDSGFPEVDSYSIKSADTKNLSFNLSKYTSDLSLDTFKDSEYDIESLKCFHDVSSVSTTNSDMSNHLCTICEQLMVDDHRPQIVNPCGHSFCLFCISAEKFCPSCRTEVESIEENDKMAKIILRFQVKKAEDDKKKNEVEAQKYIEEYNLLDIRTNAMKEEAADIIDNMEKITLELVEKKKTIKTIVDNGGNIQKQIEDLRHQLKCLEMNCGEESEGVRRLENEYEGCKTQLIMAEKTLKALKQSKERVKIIVRTFIPSLEFDAE